MDAPQFTGPDDRDLDPRRDAPAKPQMVPCAGYGDPVRALTSRPRAARVYCDECVAHGGPIRQTGTL